LCIACLSLSLYQYSDASTSKAKNVVLQQANAELERTRNVLTKDLQQTVGTEIPVSYASASVLLAQPKQKGTARLQVRNTTFPCKISWKTADNEKTFVAASIGDMPTWEVPADDRVEIVCTPLHTSGWYQLYGIVHANRYYGSTLGKFVISVEDGDNVILQLQQPIPPWNAVMIRIDSHWVLVTLEAPWAQFKVENLTDPAQEDLPNTALCWAKVGSDGLARELAAYFVAERNKTHWGRFWGKMQTSMIVPASEDEVAPSFQRITEEELATHLFDAFELLRKQRPPAGPSIQDEINAAERILNSLSKPS